MLVSSNKPHLILKTPWRLKSSQLANPKFLSEGRVSRYLSIILMVVILIRYFPGLDKLNTWNLSWFSSFYEAMKQISVRKTERRDFFFRKLIFKLFNPRKETKETKKKRKKGINFKFKCFEEISKTRDK